MHIHKGDANVKQGWQCPKCLTILAPNVKSCKKCQKNESNDGTEQQLLLEN